MTAETAAKGRDWWVGSPFETWFRDAVAGEIARLRRSAGERLAPSDALAMDEEGLGLDSLERLRLSAALAGLLGGGAAPADRFERLRTWGEWREEARRLAAGSTHMGFRTSGSTGRPKLVLHHRSELAEEVAELAERLAPKRIATLVPTHHVYGFLFAMLLPARLGSTVDDGRGALIATARDAGAGSVLAAAPPHVAALIEAGVRPAAGVTLVSSGGPLAADLHRDALAAGFARVFEIYGSTETIGIGWRDDPDAPFRLFRRWRRFGEATLIAASRPERGPIEPPDHVVFDGDRLIRPTGRRDAAVIIGGVTVHPAAVARRLCELPTVDAAAVRPMRTEEGDRLKAFVVPTDATADEKELSTTLDRFVREIFAPAERPRVWRFGRRLPIDERGKPADWPIDPL